MNVLVQFFGVAINFLMAPFEPTAPLLSPQKINRGACTSGLFKMGENELKMSLAPRGFCPNCCPVKYGVDVRFMFYNSTADPGKGIGIEPHEPGAARRAGVDATAPTVIFIHGFTEPSPGQSGRTIAKAYLSRQDNHNVILLDWSELATFPWYKPAVRNVKIVAERLKTFLEVFNDSGEIPLKTVHVIGFSLGSHIAGFAGKRLRPGLRLPRITALDPAFPEFSAADISRRLSKNDAEFVDVIHTDSGVLGLPFPVGHADFYPNGGRALQPGCQPSYLVQIRLIDQIFACSHVRAWRLYAESVRNPGAFPASKCRIWRGPNRQCTFTADATMGFPSNKSNQGQFYLITNYKPPYSKTAQQQSTD